MDWDLLKDRNPALYHVAHEGGTEPEHSGTYVHTTDSGIYHCAVCGTPLFSSETKFDSGTGWPSFTQPLTPETLVLEKDEEYGMCNTDVRCASCDAHLGRLFSDEREAHGKVCDRYSINSISLVLQKQL